MKQYELKIENLKRQLAVGFALFSGSNRGCFLQTQFLVR